MDPGLLFRWDYHHIFKLCLFLLKMIDMGITGVAFLRRFLIWMPKLVTFPTWDRERKIAKY